MVTKTCEVCGESFEALRKDARYCSNACRQRRKRRKARGVYVPRRPAAPPRVAAAPPPKECQAAVQDAHRLANDLGRLAAGAPERLRPKFARLAVAVSEALEREGL